MNLVIYSKLLKNFRTIINNNLMSNELRTSSFRINNKRMKVNKIIF